MRSLYSGACGFGDMRSRFLYIRDMLVTARGNIDRFRATAVIKDKLISNDPQERFSDDPQGRQEIFKCLAAQSQYSLPVEALNLIVKLSKSLSWPVEVNN